MRTAHAIRLLTALSRRLIVAGFGFRLHLLARRRVLRLDHPARQVLLEVEQDLGVDGRERRLLAPGLPVPGREQVEVGPVPPQGELATAAGSGDGRGTPSRRPPTSSGVRSSGVRPWARLGRFLVPGLICYLPHVGLIICP